MVVRLHNNFFGDGIRVKDKTGRVITGRYWKKGIYPNWPQAMPVPKCGEVLSQVPDEADEDIIQFRSGTAFDDVLPASYTHRPSKKREKLADFDMDKV